MKYSVKRFSKGKTVKRAKHSILIIYGVYSEILYNRKKQKNKQKQKKTKNEKQQKQRQNKTKQKKEK